MALNRACSQLTTVERIRQLCTSCDVDKFLDEYGEEALDEIIDAGSDLIAGATANGVTGRCSIKVRPCSDGVCGCWGPCTCCNVDGIVLFGFQPAVTQVKVDGVVLDPSAYKLVDNRVLVRVDGSSWPVWQNVALADSQTGTFSVTFEHGDTGGWVGLMAATEMSCDLIEASVPNGRPKLPPHAISALMDGVALQLDASQLTGFPWLERLQGLYPGGDRPVYYSPEAEGHYSLHVTA